MTKVKPDKETLRRLYWDEHQSLKALGLRFDVDGATIRNWMLSYDIPRRDLSPGKKRSKHHSEAISRGQKRLIAEGKRRFDGKYNPSWKGGPVTVSCGWCDGPVVVPRAYAKAVKQTFCKGTDCRNKWMSYEHQKRRYDKPHYGGQDVTCEHCGKVFRRDNSAIAGNEHAFCSRECQQLSHHVELTCANCGKDFTRPSHRNRPTEYVFCSQECKKEFLRGDKIHNWSGGYTGYYGSSWNAQRDKARERDGYTCQHCGKPEGDVFRQLDVHHKIPFREFGIENHAEANKLDNLTSLCPSCHSSLPNDA